MDYSTEQMPKRKAFPVQPNQAWLDRLLQSCIGILAINWICQGMRGMQRKELGFRAAFGLVFAMLAGMLMMTAGLQPALAVLFGLIAGHSVNFLVNGQFWVCARYCRCYRGKATRIDLAARRLARELADLPWLEEVAFIGSRARDRALSDRSDLDLRLIFPQGPAGWWRTNLLLLRLRARALWAGLPLDLYAYDAPDALLRVAKDEPLLVAKDVHGRLRRICAARVVILDDEQRNVA